MKNKKPFYLTKREVAKINQAETFHELVLIARIVLNRMGNHIVQVCGPISTGGSRSVNKNLKIFADAINFLNKRGLSVFNQLPFERAFDRIMREYRVSGYDTPILEEFYGPLFDFGKIKKIYFLPGWRGSVGARWEYNYAKKSGIKTIIMPKDWMRGY